MAEPRVAQQLSPREALPVVEHKPLPDLPPPREELPSPLHGAPQLHLLRLVHLQPLQGGKDPLVAPLVLRELVHAAAGQVVEQLRLLEVPEHRRPAEGVLHRRQLAEISQQQEPHVAVRRELGDVGPQPDVELRDFFHDQPVQGAAAGADGAPHPVVRRLRSHAQILHGAVRLRDERDPLAELRELRHDLLRQVRLPHARHA